MKDECIRVPEPPILVNPTLNPKTLNAKIPSPKTLKPPKNNQTTGQVGGLAVWISSSIKIIGAFLARIGFGVEGLAFRV